MVRRIKYLIMTVAALVAWNSTLFASGDLDRVTRMLEEGAYVEFLFEFNLKGRSDTFEGNLKTLGNCYRVEVPDFLTVVADSKNQYLYNGELEEITINSQTENIVDYLLYSMAAANGRQDVEVTFSPEGKPLEIFLPTARKDIFYRLKVINFEVRKRFPDGEFQFNPADYPGATVVDLRE